MADKNKKKDARASRRRSRVRGKVFGTAERPRLTVARSLNHVYAQIIDDENKVTLVAAASNAKNVKDKLGDAANKTATAKIVGEVIAAEAKDKGIEVVVFDRNRFRYHGRVKALAEGAREGGLKL